MPTCKGDAILVVDEHPGRTSTHITCTFFLDPLSLKTVRETTVPSSKFGEMTRYVSAALNTNEIITAVRLTDIGDMYLYSDNTRDNDVSPEKYHGNPSLVDGRGQCLEVSHLL